MMVEIAMRPISESSNWADTLNKWLTIVFLQASKSATAAGLTVITRVADEAIAKFVLAMRYAE